MWCAPHSLCHSSSRGMAPLAVCNICRRRVHGQAPRATVFRLAADRTTQTCWAPAQATISAFPAQTRAVGQAVTGSRHPATLSLAGGLHWGMHSRVYRSSRVHSQADLHLHS